MPYCSHTKLLPHGGKERCRYAAKRDGLCLIHHPEAVKRRATTIDERQQRQRVEIEAQRQHNIRRAEDADRMHWLAKYWNGTVADEKGAGPVYQFIVLNRLRLGGVRECIDHLRGKK